MPSAIDMTRVATSDGAGPAAQATALARATALVVAGIPFFAFSTLVLHQLYISGSFLWDVGFQANLMWQGDPRLPTSPAMPGGSFYATHVTPVLSFIALFAGILPVPMTDLFAGFIGIAHALPGIGVFWLLLKGYQLRTPLAIATAGLIALLFAFDGLALAIARYPHFEMLLAGSAVLFIAALLQRRLIIASICFVLCLATREDAGFHLFAVLSVWLALDRWRGVRRPMQTATVIFAALALLYSVAALAAQSAIFPEHQSSFARIYLGHPALGGITPETVFIRVVACVVYRTYIVLPAVIALVWAVLARNPYIVVGYVAVMPWTLLHLLAATPLAATLSSYYAFPFVIASFWPLAGALLGPQPIAARQVMMGFTLMLAASFTALSSQHNPAGMRFPDAFLSPPSAEERHAIDRAIAALVRAKPDLGRVLVDGSILAFAPAAFSWSEGVPGRPAEPPNTIIYFARGYEAATIVAIAEAAQLDKTYRVPGTPIVLLSDRSLTEVEALSSIISGAPQQTAR
jgi:hypothetical protein